MSSVSSHDGSDKDSVRHKTSTDGILPPRYAALRKTDLLDAMDSLGRTRGAGDTDTWSVAATIDDQESVISVQGNGGLVGLSSNSTTTLDMAHEDSTCTSSLDNKATNGGDSTTLVGNGGGNSSNASSSDMTLDNNINNNNNNSNIHLAPGLSMDTMSDDDDYDQRSRSNAAEFGDDGGTRSAASDFNMDSDNEDGQRQRLKGHTQPSHHHVVNDSIAAPPQPQPSFAIGTKSYVELLEENDLLQTQIHTLRTTQKHQAQVIEHLRSLTDEQQGKDDDEAPMLSKLPPPQQSQEPLEQQQQQDVLMMDQDGNDDHTTTMTTLLERLYHRLHQFVAATVDLPWQPSLEQQLFSSITEMYLVALPFGTDNQQLLNTAYRDQRRRFQSTLGASFATWYRRQTVQSLSLNPATKDYLEQMQHQLSLQLMTILPKHDGSTSEPVVDQAAWMDILHLCHVLSLKIHGGESDVLVQPISPSAEFDPHRMTALVADAASASYIPVSSNHDTSASKVKYVLSPLFIDDDDQVLLTARVILDD